jgi:hypothetical protein
MARNQRTQPAEHVPAIDFSYEPDASVIESATPEVAAVAAVSGWHLVSASDDATAISSWQVARSAFWSDAGDSQLLAFGRANGELAA